MTTIDYPAPDADVTLVYDQAGRRTAMTDGLGSTTWAYDSIGRPITITQPFTGSVIYGYDSTSNRTSLQYPDGKVVTYTYDLASRLVRVQDWQALATQYAYNAAGQVLTTTLPNGVTSSYTYDNAERLIGLSHQTLTQTLRVYTYTVDAVGNRTQAQESTPSIAVSGRSSIASGAVSANGTRSSITPFTGGTANLLFTRSGGPSVPVLETITYTYDSLYRLTNATYASGSVFTYTYDAVGNRLTETTITNTTVYTYDIANRLVNVGGVAQTWDNNGNLLNAGVYTYTYDSANRPITITQGANTYTFAYMGTGDRLRQIANGVPTTYTLDLNAGLTQVLADGTNTYLYGNGRIAQHAGPTPAYFLADALGSVRQLANASGAVTLAKSYQPYGSMLSSAGGGTSIYGWTGEIADNTGLVYLRARNYALSVGRFITPDPSRQEHNLFTYASNNPVNVLDPSGLKGIVPWSQYEQQVKMDLRNDIGKDRITARRAIFKILANFEGSPYSQNFECDPPVDVQTYVDLSGNGRNYNSYDWLFSGWADYWVWAKPSHVSVAIDPNFAKAVAWRESFVGNENSFRFVGFTNYLAWTLRRPHAPVDPQTPEDWQMVWDNNSLNKRYDLSWGRFNFTDRLSPNRAMRYAQEVGAMIRWLYAANYAVNREYRDDSVTWYRALQERYGPKPDANNLFQYNPCYGYQILSLAQTGKTYLGSSAATLGLGFEWSEIKSLYSNGQLVGPPERAATIANAVNAYINPADGNVDARAAEIMGRCANAMSQASPRRSYTLFGNP